MTPLYLRVDVCTYRGLRHGVPGVLEVLKRTGARATFFVTFGPDASGLALFKMLDPSFARNVLRANPGKTYGWQTAFYGTLLPAPRVGSGLPHLVRRIRDEGHEVGMHGWDHRRWQDSLPRIRGERLRREFTLMIRAYERAVGSSPVSFSAPAWRVSKDLLRLEEEAGLAFAADARGPRPFLARFEGQDFRVPQLPISLPTLDESLLRGTTEGFVEETLALAERQDYACFAAHAETEGLFYRDAFEKFLSRLGRPAVPLGEAPRIGLPRVEMRMSEFPGRPYKVCVCKGPAAGL